MTDITTLNTVTLTPVVKLEPADFSNGSRQSPSGSVDEYRSEWDQYWKACLADSGIRGLNPLVPGSWLVSTAEFSESQLQIAVRVILDSWGGVSTLDDPDSRSPLSGGFALSSDVLGLIVTPTCCGDLSNIESWQEAAALEEDQWTTLWIGHPWLSTRYQAPWLLLSDLHESEPSAARWAVSRDDLTRAIVPAEAELARFSQRIAVILDSWNYRGDVAEVARHLSGLSHH